jgi:hypothetical protein
VCFYRFIKRILKKLVKQNFKVQFDLIDPYQFVDIYHETMSRVNAKDDYFFDKNYFRSLSKIDGVFQTNVIDSNNKIMCSGIFFPEGQYHLGATLNDYVDLSPSTMMIYESAKYMQSHLHQNKLNLGGGNANLLGFKKSFSKSIQYYSTHKIILDQERYDHLTHEYKQNIGTTNENFPAYRI